LPPQVTVGKPLQVESAMRLFVPSQLLALGTLFLPSLCHSQGTSAPFTHRPIKAVRVSAPPKINGDLSDPVWSASAKADTFVDVTTGNPAPEQTSALIAYDDKNIYVAFTCVDAQPSAITARETVRDSKYRNAQNGPGETEDNVEVRIDTFQSHKREDLSKFSVNAIGTPSSLIAGGRANKAEWKGDFLTAVKRTATGWQAEMQIPWSTINYPSSQVPVNMGINFFRFQLRTQVSSLWSNTGPQGFVENEGIWQNVQVPKQAFHPKLSLLPYALGAIEPKGGSVRFGMDARYPITPQLTAVGTLKPDFSTVEGAVESIQFSRQERFVPDRRPFFLEGADDFNISTRLNDIGAFFYPRRIHSFDFGTKIYGQISPTNTLGFLDTYDLNGRNDMVARLRHDLGPTSKAGLFISQKSSGDETNTVAAFDYHGRWGKVGFENIEGISKGTGVGGGREGGGASIYNVTFEDKVLLGALQYHDISNNFHISDGYIPNVGYKGFVGVGVWQNQWRHGPWRAFQAVVVPQLWWHTDGKVYQRGLDVANWFDTRSDWHLAAEYSHFMYDESTDSTLTLTAINGVSNRFRQYGLQLQTGILGDHRATFLGPNVSWRLFKKLDVAYTGALLNLQGVTQQHILTANYELSPTRSFGGRVVTQDANTNWYVFYHNSGGRGTEMFVVLGDPNALKFLNRLEVKFVFVK
jgi:hypothetical protein